MTFITVTTIHKHQHLFIAAVFRPHVLNVHGVLHFYFFFCAADDTYSLMIGKQTKQRPCPHYRSQ